MPNPVARAVSLWLLLVTFFGGALSAAVRKEPEVASPLYGGADPWYCEYDGAYYHCYSLGGGVGVKTASTVEGLASAPGTTVYTAPERGPYSRDYWAPELHRIGDKWYIYVAADDGDNRNHRMVVLRGEEPTGPFAMVGKLADPADRWAIDGTVLQTEGGLYFIWSGWAGETDGEQSLYIAPMSSPTEISGERVRISRPEYRWEKNGMPINEGPAVLKRDGRVYLVYSASGSWTDDYCLGMLALCGSDPLRAENWAKCPVPVFRQRETAYGPGHCSFVSSPDGKTDYIVYHANIESGTGWGGRSVRVQSFRWVLGAPVFGEPLAAEAFG